MAGEPKGRIEFLQDLENTERQIVQSKKDVMGFIVVFWKIPRVLRSNHIPKGEFFLRIIHFDFCLPK